ncbi:MAG: type I DNA topoisomerase [Spirochaetaceae bacterium]|nr:type I DNA topoisomerase [Spirochaetaceae bacterium]
MPETASISKETTKAAPKKTAAKKTVSKKSAAKKTAALKTGAKKKIKKLLIVESPAKAKTIKKILGRDFSVKASVGHIRDLKSGRGKKAFGIDIENDYKPEYTVIKGKEKTVKELQKAASDVDEIYLAPDPDREGEAIAWHLKEIIGETDKPIKRVTYSAVTKKAVLDAIENPGEINMDRVHAQQGRRILDRLVGFSLSPFLWKKVAKNLSAGRVQSVAVRMVVDREREIAAFIPEEFWRINASIFPEGKKKELFEAALKTWKGKKFALGTDFAEKGESVKEIAEILRNADYKVEKVDKKRSKGKPGAPFITSTLQQAASTKLSFGTSKTMSVAQKLYEGIELESGLTGLITYMRTDSTNIAPEAIEEVRAFINDTYGDKYLPAKENVYTSKKKAHEAIRPSSVANTPEMVKPFLTKDQFRLYEIIWQRFVASQMNPAEYDITTVTISADQGIFEAKGRVEVFKGYTVLVGENKIVQKGKEEDKYQKLPKLDTDSPVELDNLEETQHFTKPPPRYSEASLVKAMEKEGIGRPSTYAPIIKTIRDRGYVRLEKRAFHATELGMAVNDILLRNFTNIMDLQFTAGMEESLDEVEQGNKDWVRVIDEFYKPFLSRLEEAMEKAEPLKGRDYDGEETCPLCGGPLVIRYSKNGAFLGCKNYPECKGLISMPGGEFDDDDEDSDIKAVEVDCPECGKPMILKTSRYGKKFYACTGYPECKTTLSADKEGKPVEMPKIERDCNKCGKPMVVKAGRSGNFLACSGYPDCKNTLPIDKDGNVVDVPDVSGEICDKCGSEMVVKMGRRGPFLACSAFPKCRNAKPLPGGEPSAASGTGKKEKE